MAIGAAGIQPSSGTASSQTSQENIEEQTQLFLQLLLTQLQNQNPLDPVDVNEFTNQLVQYSSLEQQLIANSKQDKIISELNQFNAINGFSFVGATAQIDGSVATLEDGVVSWNYSLAAPAESVRLVVKDAQGNIVFETAGDVSLGNQTLSVSHEALPDTIKDNDALTLSVEAVDDRDQRIDALVTSQVVIDSLVQIDGILRYSSGNVSFTFDQILSLTKPERILQDVPEAPV